MKLATGEVDSHRFSRAPARNPIDNAASLHPVELSIARELERRAQHQAKAAASGLDDSERCGALLETPTQQDDSGFEIVAISTELQRGLDAQLLVRELGPPFELVGGEDAGRRLARRSRFGRRGSAAGGRHADGVAACRAGIGLAVLPDFFASGTGLVRVVARVDGARIYLAQHPDLSRTPRVKAVAGWLRRAVRERLRDLG